MNLKQRWLIFCNNYKEHELLWPNNLWIFSFCFSLLYSIWYHSLLFLCPLHLSLHLIYISLFRHILISFSPPILFFIVHFFSLFTYLFFLFILLFLSVVMKDQYDHRLRSLRQEHEKIKIQYEARALLKVGGANS